MTDPTAAFAKMVPGFDFLQGLVKGAGAAMPGVGQWVAPTLDPEELDKRIQELRTVQYWLEQNARLMGATIQALEVQRMTLSTLKTMNVSMSDLTESLRIRMPEPAPAPAPAAAAPAAAPVEAPPPAAADAAKPAVPPGVIDPMQWWGALTQQFTELAANAMKDGSADAATKIAGEMVQKSIDAATAATAGFKPAAKADAKPAAKAAAKTAARTGKPAAPRGKTG